MVVVQQTTFTTTTSTDEVDMNIYNLSNLDDICQEWTAVATAATPLLDEGIYLRARNDKQNYADTVSGLERDKEDQDTAHTHDWCL